MHQFQFEYRRLINRRYLARRGDYLGTSGAAGLGSDIRCAQRQGYSVGSGPHTGSRRVQVSISVVPTTNTNVDNQDLKQVKQLYQANFDKIQKFFKFFSSSFVLVLFSSHFVFYSKNRIWRKVLVVFFSNNYFFEPLDVAQKSEAQVPQLQTRFRNLISRFQVHLGCIAQWMHLGFPLGSSGFESQYSRFFQCSAL